MLKTARIVLIISLVNLVVMPITLYFLQPGVGEVVVGKYIQISFTDFYFGINPGLICLSLALLFFNKLSSHDKEHFSMGDYIWTGIFVFSGLVFILAYTSDVDSVFHQIPVFAFLLPEKFRGFSPTLHTFALWVTLFGIIISSIFLYKALTRIKYDAQKTGAVMIGIIISLSLAVFLLRLPALYYAEEWVVSFLFKASRNPEAQYHPETDSNYCPAPYNEKGEKISLRPPIPKGIRDDIVIVGISNKTIEQVHGKWPLNWEHYANLADRFDNAPGSILMFDISFLDYKGPYGGEICDGKTVKCVPLGGYQIRDQKDILAESIARVKNSIILTDYPMETTDAAKDLIVDYERRMNGLDERMKLTNVKDGKYGQIWARLPEPPIAPVLDAVQGVGYANILKDQFGLNRKMPIVIRIVNEDKWGEPGYNPDLDDSFYPGIDVLIAAHYYGVDPQKDIEVNWLKGYVKIKNIPQKTTKKLITEEMAFKDVDIMAKPNANRTVTIPIDHRGLMNINFRGGRYCYPFYEILEVNRMSDQEVEQRFKDKIALVAMYYATGVGTAKDMHLSPYGDMAGIEHHAYALNTILNQDFARQAAPWVNLLILVVLGVLMGFYQPRVSTLLSFLLLIVVGVAFIVFSFFFSFNQLNVIHAIPTVILEQVLIFGVFIGFRVLTEEENVKFIRNTFSKFVSKDVVDELLNNPDAISLGGAKKEVSVFFSDVRGFTTISEQLGPEELVKLLNEYLSVMTDLIIEYRGTIDKYMGDAIMAFWGAPVQNDDHAYFTCVAAIAQLNALEVLRTQWAEKGATSLDIGIGINSGQAVVGNMGSSHRMDYTLMGDTVNLGSRLEGITKQYSVRMVISEYTYEKVKNRVYARELDLVRVKGKVKPVRIYELMGLVNDEDLEKLKRASKAP